MGKTLATRTKVAIASTYGTAIVMSALSNAAEAVATLAPGHGVAVGDYLEVNSGWPLAAGIIARAKAVATNDVTLELIDTTSTSQYPAGEGVGTVRKITGWTTITQLAKDGGITTEGGETKFAPATTMDDDDDKEVPDGQTAVRIKLVVFDDPTLPWYPVVRAVADNQRLAAIRVMAANGSKTFANGYWGMPRMQQINSGQLQKLQLTFAADSRPTRYAS